MFIRPTNPVPLPQSPKQQPLEQAHQLRHLTYKLHHALQPTPNPRYPTDPPSDIGGTSKKSHPHR